MFVEELCDIASTDGPWIVLNSHSLPPFVQQLSDHKTLDGFNLMDTGDFLRQLGVLGAEEFHKQIHEVTEGNAQLLTLLSNSFSPQEPLSQLLDRLVDNPDIENFLLQRSHDNLTSEEQAIMKAVAIFRNYPDTKNVVEAMLIDYKVKIEIKHTLIQLKRRHLLFDSGENNKKIVYRQHSTVQQFYYDLLNDSEKLDMHYYAAKYYEDQDRDTFRSAIHYQKAGKHKCAAQVIVEDDIWTHIILGHTSPLLDMLQEIDKEELQPEFHIKIEVIQGELYAYLHENEKAEECFDSAWLKISGKSKLFLPEVRTKICLNMGEIFDHKDNDEALKWLQLGLKNLDDIKKKSSVLSVIPALSSNLTKGRGSFLNKMFEKWKPSLPLGVEITEALGNIRMALNVKMGSIYIAKGDYDAAIQYTQDAISLSSNIPTKRQAIAYLNLSCVHFNKGDIQLGVEETDRSIAICEQIHDQYWLVNGLMNLGLFYFQANEHTKAFQIMEERLLPMLERLDSVKMRTNYGLNLGYMYFLKEDYINARSLLEESLQLSQTYDLKEMNISLLHSLVELEMKGGALHLVESYLEQAFVLIKQTGTDRLLGENQSLQREFNSIKENYLKHQPMLN